MSNENGVAVITPWVREEQLTIFLDAWSMKPPVEDWIFLQQDIHREGCGVMKNRGVKRALDSGFDAVVILDDDCFPASGGPQTLRELAAAHVRELDRKRSVLMYEQTADPPARGTPYREQSIEMPVAASMGFWEEIGDYCAVRQLATNGAQMECLHQAIHGRYFSLCGMNLAFRPKEWLPWCTFIEVPRFDDIWMGWLWQREAYRRGFCFSLHGPTVRHSRQSNVWLNLREEVMYLEQSETLWRDIATAQSSDYRALRSLLPC